MQLYAGSRRDVTQEVLTAYDLERYLKQLRPAFSAPASPSMVRSGERQCHQTVDSGATARSGELSFDGRLAGPHPVDYNT